MMLASALFYVTFIIDSEASPLKQETYSCWCHGKHDLEVRKTQLSKKRKYTLWREA